MVTSYSYNDAGDLSAIDYSDNTPDVSFTYDRLGRQKTASSSISEHTFAYNSLLLDTETIVSPAGTNVIDRSYDGYGRSMGFALDSDYNVAYGYDAFGRLNQISNVQFQASYSYLANSDLISTIANGDLQTTRTYEQNRDLFTQVKNEIDSSTLSQFDYANDAGGRRTSIKYSGSAFETGPAFNLYGYNSKSEVQTADRYWGANLNDTSDPVSGQSFAYSYDNIGNQTASLRENEEMDYTANNLNQYTQRTIPDGIDILGSAETNSTVTVNDLATSRHGKYWYKDLTVTNSASAAYQQVNVVGVYNPPGTNDPDVVSTSSGHVFVAKTPETFTYDDDGNLLSDGRFNYTWDSENRLIGAETLTSLPASVPRVKVEFVYDYMSRRISKTVYNWVSNDWQEVSSMTFIYDGWNMIAEKTTSITSFYTYGLDLSGTLQSAGGVGGLLATRIGTNNVCYTFDGNGNVSELISDLGSLAAHYEYSPFGETIVATGPMAQENHFRFSTKYCDPDCNLYDFGMRWYSPSLGRWLSRDPIGERGLTTFLFKKESLIYFSLLCLQAEKNLYAYVENDVLNYVDINGLWKYHGNWGGPDWTGGQTKPYEDLTPEEKAKLKPPVDAEDKCYKEHDLGYSDCRVKNNSTSKDCPTDEQKKAEKACEKECDKKLDNCLKNLKGKDDSWSAWWAEWAF